MLSDEQVVELNEMKADVILFYELGDLRSSIAPGYDLAVYKDTLLLERSKIDAYRRMLLDAEHARTLK